MTLEDGRQAVVTVSQCVCVCVRACHCVCVRAGGQVSGWVVILINKGGHIDKQGSFSNICWAKAEVDVSTRDPSKQACLKIMDSRTGFGFPSFSYSIPGKLLSNTDSPERVSSSDHPESERCLTLQIEQRPSQ